MVNPIVFPFLLLPHAFQGHYYLEAFKVLGRIKLRVVSVEILPCSPIPINTKWEYKKNKPFILCPKFLMVLFLDSNFWCLSPCQNSHFFGEWNVKVVDLLYRWVNLFGYWFIISLKHFLSLLRLTHLRFQRRIKLTPIVILIYLK